MAVGTIGSLMSATTGGIVPTAPTRSMGVQDAAETDAAGGTSFGQYLVDALEQVNALQRQSTQMTDDFIAGRTDSIHEVLIAGEKASLSLQLALEIRNKVLEAYQEINRMQI